MPVRILRLPDVTEATGLSRATIYSMIAKGEFPSQVQLSTRCVGWKEHEVTSWLCNLKSKAPPKSWEETPPRVIHLRSLDSEK